MQLEPVDSPILRRAVAQAQRIVEGQNFDVRLNLWRYSHFVEQQRRVFSERRRVVLMGTDPPGLLQERAPDAYERARRALGETTLQDLERRLTLQAIDECWAEHLATVAEIREGIHLAEVGGLSPLEEFQKGAAASFLRARDSVDGWVVERFSPLEITPDGVDLEGMGLRGPSSTWTYLVNDDAFSDRMAAMLLSRRNIGFAANAALTGPLLLVWALSRRLRRRGKL
jgi:preprotein translocase subunit SecA